MTHSNEHNHSKQGASSLESCWRGQEEENVEDDDYRRGISSYQWKQALPWKRLRGFTTHVSKMRFAAKRTVNISIEPHEPRKKWPSTTGGRPQGVWNVDSRFVSTSTLWCNTACDKGELPPHAHTLHIHGAMFVLMNLLHGFNDLSPPPGFVVLEAQSKGLPLKGKQPCLWYIIHQSGAIVVPVLSVEVKWFK